MGTTPNYTWPYPELTDPPDGAGQIKALANAIDTSLKQLIDPLNAPALTVVHQTVAQNIPTATTTPISFDAEDIDTTDMHSTSTNPSRLTCKKAGWYRLTGAISFTSNATGRRFANWFINGVQVPHTAIGLVPTAANSYVAAATDIIRLALNDYVELRGYQDSGAQLTTIGSSGNRPFATAQYICP